METIGIWGEFLGGLGVIVSLIFLAHQIRISNKLAIAASEREIMGNFASINELQMGNSDASGIMAKLVCTEAAFDTGEKEKARAFVRRMANVWRAAEASHSQGFLTEATYQIVPEDVRMHLTASPGMQKFVSETLDMYPTITSGLMDHSRQVIKEISDSALDIND